MRAAMLETPPAEAPAEAAAVEPQSDTVWWTFPATALHARLARTWLAGWLEDQRPGTGDRAFASLVAFSEVVTNAVLHDAGPITIHARLTRRQLVCEVTDRCVELPPPLEAGPEHERSRRLSLVDALADRWWVLAAQGGGKTTCFVTELGPEPA